LESLERKWKVDNFPDLEKIFSRNKENDLKKWIFFQIEVDFFQIPISNIEMENPKIGISRKKLRFFLFIPLRIFLTRS
jgi:hypothetical protein